MVAAPKRNLVDVRLELLDESPTNPRKHFDEATLAELAASIKEIGLQDPILVRPMEGGRYRVVCGHRRTRAARQAELATLPAEVREMTDAQETLVQLVELQQREEVHPLDESDLFKVLLERDKLPEAEIAAKLGKSLHHVAMRLKLCALTPPGRKAYLEGKFSDGAALELARVPEQLQVEAVKQLLSMWGHVGTISRERAKQYIDEHCSRLLKDASFDTADAQLVPKAGACTACPKRTGNQLTLYPDAKSPDTCTDTGCFKAKSDADWKRRADAARAAGQSVLADKNVDNVFDRWNSQHSLSYSADFVDLDTKAEADPKKRTWRKLLGPELDNKAIILARDQGGRSRYLAKPAVVKRLAEKVLPKAAAKKLEDVGTASHRDDSYKREEAKRQEKAKIGAEVARRAIDAVIKDVFSEGRSSPQQAQKIGCPRPHQSKRFWQVLLVGMLETSWHDVIKDVAKRMELEVPKGKQPEEVLRKHIDSLAGLEAASAELALEMVITYGARPGSWGSYGKNLTHACQVYGVDLKKLEEEVKRERKEKKGTKRGGAKPGGAAPAQAACLVPECIRPGATKFLCVTHYRKARKLKFGDTLSSSQLMELAGLKSGQTLVDLAAKKKAPAKASAKVATKPAPAEDAFESPACIGCGCTEDRACPEGCSWIEPEAIVDGVHVPLCSSCVGILDEPLSKEQLEDIDIEVFDQGACLVPACGREVVAGGLCRECHKEARALKFKPDSSYSTAQLRQLGEKVGA